MTGDPDWPEALERALRRLAEAPAGQEAVRLVREELAARPCVCLALNPFYTVFEERYLGTGEHDSEVRIKTCRHCRRVWLHYYYEDNVHDTSGRWYRSMIDPSQVAALDADRARDFLNAAPWKYCGGGYFDGRPFVSVGKDLPFF